MSRPPNIAFAVDGLDPPSRAVVGGATLAEYRCPYSGRQRSGGIHFGGWEWRPGLMDLMGEVLEGSMGDL
jgi:hypothetical protein